MLLTRRQFLVGTAAVVSAAGATAYLGRSQVRRLLVPELDTGYPLGRLKDGEARTIAALGEVLVSPTSMPPPEFFRDYADSVTQRRPGFLKEYQDTAKLLDGSAREVFGRSPGGNFAALTLAERSEVLAELLWQYSGLDSVRPKLEKLTAGRDALGLRMFVMQPLIEHYYRSPYGWAVVGYQSFPGMPPGDSRAYTRPPNAVEAVA